MISNIVLLINYKHTEGINLPTLHLPEISPQGMSVNLHDLPSFYAVIPQATELPSSSSRQPRSSSISRAILSPVAPTAAFMDVPLPRDVRLQLKRLTVGFRCCTPPWSLHRGDVQAA